MKMKSPEDKLRKRIKNMRWERWFVLLLGCFQIVASSIVYGQGKKVNETIGKDAYGIFFRDAFDTKKSYSGWKVLAEGRYAASMLYLGSGLFLCALSLSSFWVLKRDSELLHTIEELRSEVQSR
jgi:hypothetical protein